MDMMNATYLSERLNDSAVWREEKAKEYPEDAERNINAAKRLYKIAEDLIDPARDAEAMLASVDFSDERLLEMLNIYITSIGFRDFPDNAHDFIEEIHRMLAGWRR